MDTDLTNIIGGCIKEKRHAAGLNLPQLAQQSRVAASTISRIESGAIFPTVPTLLTLSDVLDIDLMALLGELGYHAKRGSLPDFENYLRHKYGLSELVIAKASAYFDRQTDGNGLKK